MEKRTIIILISVLSCMGAVWLVAAQHQQLVALRSERTAAPTAAEADAESKAALQDVPPPTAAPMPGEGGGRGVPSELLQLRSRVTQLSARVREMSTVTQENARLRGQLVTAAQNAGTGIQLPAGYVRRTQAKQMGYRTPEDTIQSFFYALNKRDVTNLMATMTPNSAGRFAGLPHEEFFKGAEQVPGFFVKSREELPDGGIVLRIEVVPGLPAEPFRFEPVNGEWKLSMPW